MVREGREGRSRTDYILGVDHCLFWNVSVWDPRHNSDHYMVLGCLHSASLKEHARYLGGRKRPPLCPPTKVTREDKIFAALKRAVPKSRAQEARKKAWISATTWRLVDERVSARWDLAKYQALILRLDRTKRASLRTDRKRQAEQAGSEVEALLGSYPLCTVRPGTRSIDGIRRCLTMLRRPLGLPSSGSRQRGWNCAGTYHPWGRTSPFLFSRSWCMTQCLQRKK